MADHSSRGNMCLAFEFIPTLTHHPAIILLLPSGYYFFTCLIVYPLFFFNYSNKLYHVFINTLTLVIRNMCHKMFPHSITLFPHADAHYNHMNTSVL